MEDHVYYNLAHGVFTSTLTKDRLHYFLQIKSGDSFVLCVLVEHFFFVFVLGFALITSWYYK